MEYGKVMKVARAVIEKDGYILAAQRGEDVGYSLKWEFPGGKIKEGESPVECVVREIKEELDAEVDIVYPLKDHMFKRGYKDMKVISFVCRMLDGEAKCLEHKELVWDKPENLSGLDWTEADFAVYLDYLEHKKKTQ
jgi:8-oxo-dGTP diphosphatase